MDSNSSYTKLVFFQSNLLFFVLPFAVAPQNIVQFAFILVCLPMFFQPLSSSDRGAVSWSFLEKSLAGTMLSWIILRILVGLYRDNFEVARALQIFGGYLPLILVPWLFCKVAQTFNLYERIIVSFWNALFSISVFWCVIAASQRIYGWAFYSGQFNFEKYRSYGLYSHPLTLAYVIALFFPISLRFLIARPRSVKSWLSFVALIVVLILNESRAVQIVSMVVGSGLIFVYSKGRMRLILTSIVASVILSISSFENPIRQKFVKTYTDAVLRIESGNLPDDRLIFWKVHSNLAKEKLWVGWGAELPEEVRTKAYKDAGYSQMKDKYNAHNLYLQALVEAGIGGVLLVVTFLILTLLVCREVSQNAVDPTAKLIAEGTSFSVVAFMLASVTQNSIYDSEVRFALTIIFAMLALSAKSQTMKREEFKTVD